MFRVSTLFMATVLLFSAIPVSLAQQNSVQAQAEADASADISKADWFMLGGWGSALGCFLGCAGGCFLGGLLPHNGTQEDFALAGTILLGVCAVPTTVFIYPHNVTPPPERLLGKSPEYIATYTQAYKSRTTLLRKIFVTAGSITSNLILMTMISWIGLRAWGTKAVNSVLFGYLKVDKMKNRIGIVIIALVSLLINCFFGVGCTPLPGYITIDPRSELMNPTFCPYDNLYFQKRLRIGSIKVEKQLRSSSEEKMRWELTRH